MEHFQEVPDINRLIADEQPYQNAAPAVYGQTREMADEGGGQHHGGGQHVT